MAWQYKAWNKGLIDRAQKEGRGKGVGADYKPYLEVHDVPSLGLARRVPGVTTRRVHHLLSNVEYHFFLMLDWSSAVTDIREQFPVDREATQDMALSLRIKHPCYPGTSEPIQMSVDFMVTRGTGASRELVAYDLKRSEDAENERSLDKLELMRATLAELGFPHHLVYHSMLPARKIAHLEWIRLGMPRDGETEPFPNYFNDHCSRMLGELRTDRGRLPLNQYCAQYDGRHGVEQGTGLRIAKILMHNRVLVPNLEQADLAGAPLSSFGLREPQGHPRMLQVAA